MLTAALVWIASGALIVAGLVLVLRDDRGRRPTALLGGYEPRPPDPAQFADVTIVTGQPNPDAPAFEGPQAAASPGDRSAALAALQSSITRICAAMEGEPPSAERAPQAEAGWARIADRIAGAVAEVSAVLHSAGCVIGPAGATGWSPRGGGFGCFRRVLVDDESIAWLRTEVHADGRLVIATRAHRDDRVLLNQSAEIAAERVTTALAIDLLAEVLRPAAQFAAWSRARMPGGGDEAHIDDNAAAPPLALAPPAPASVAVDIERVADAALAAVNGALAPAGAKLVPLAAPERDPSSGHFNWTLGVAVDGRAVAQLRLAQSDSGLDVALGITDQGLIDLARQRRLDADEITVPILAETLAACAWPSIAHARQNAAQAAE